MHDDGLFISRERIIYEHRGKLGTDKYTIVIKVERRNGCAGQTGIFQSIKKLKVLRDIRRLLRRSRNLRQLHVLKATTTS